jgi:hypothetical protein
MIGLFIFGGFVIAGIITIIVFKIRWSRQSTHEWAIINARNKAIK